MEYNGEIGEFLFHGLEHVERQGRGHEASCLRITRALFGSELVSAVRCTDRDGEAVDAGTCHEVNHLLWVSIGMMVAGDFILDAREHSEFSFHSDTVAMGVVAYFLREGHILLVWKVAAVDHHR